MHDPLHLPQTRAGRLEDLFSNLTTRVTPLQIMPTISTGLHIHVYTKGAELGHTCSLPNGLHYFHSLIPSLLQCKRRAHECITIHRQRIRYHMYTHKSQASSYCIIADRTKVCVCSTWLQFRRCQSALYHPIAHHCAPCLSYRAPYRYTQEPCNST